MGERERLSRIVVLVEIGWLHDAETEVAEILDGQPDDLRALGLFAKIKHMRGELSQAIACWAQIHAQTMHRDAAHIQLTTLLHLADDPEDGAGAFVAFGHAPFRPVGALALEEAFRLFRGHRTADARARCLEFAAKNRDRNPALYKLAILAIAWIAELSGKLDEAADFLERLGKERGFETDVDRLFALARVYEQLGTPERLQAVVKIFTHLVRTLPPSDTDLSLLHRLAVAYSRLGEQELAAGWSARYLDAYRHHAYRATFDQLIAVAAQDYFPLKRLLSVRVPRSSVSDQAPRRERALARVLDGAPQEARDLLSGDDRLDQKYLADLTASEGDEARAAELFIESLDSPNDLQVVGWLLDNFRPSPSKRISRYFGRHEVVLKARALIEGAIRQAPLRPSLWRQLSTLHGIAGDTAEQSRCLEHANALARAAEARSRPVGRVLSAAVYHFIGRAKGLIHEIWAHRHPVEPGKGGTLPVDQIHGNLTPEMRAGIRNTFVSVREYVRTKFPAATEDLGNYEYTFKVPKEDEPSGGLSAGLPSALAFLSVFLQRPVPQDIASSGLLVADAHDVLSVGRVAEAEYKVNAAYQRNLRTIILPRANVVDVGVNSLVPRAIWEDIVQYAANLDEAAKLIFGEDVFAPP